MKKTKILTGFALVALTGLLLAGCSSDTGTEETTASSKTEETVASSATEESTEPEKVAGADMKDGTYTLEEKNYSNDYRATFSITVKDGAITESNYDNVNEAGESKKDNAEYNENMKGKSGVGPSEFIPELNEALLTAQSADGVEVVTGATSSTGSFKNYAQQLIQAAQAGNTETIEIDNGAAMKDGTYTLEEKNYSNDYRVVFAITVKDGKITESNYDNVNEAGESKKDNKEYDEMMTEKSGIGPSKFIPQLNEGLVAAESVGEIEVVTGATHSYHSFQMYAEQLVNAAQKGSTDVIEVDNVVFAN